MENAMVTTQGGAITESNDQMVKRVQDRVIAVNQIYKRILVPSSKDEKGNEISGDYGLIPGCGNKPTLLKAGAEKLLMAFRVAPTFKTEIREYDGGHREIITTCTLTGQGGEILGEGVGSCSTLESKYRYRNVADFEVQESDIPKDAKEKKAEYRKQGFGMRQIEGVWRWVKYLDSQKTENPDIADTYNTVLKMSKKRSQIDAVLTVFGASDIFTQDVEDLQANKSPAPAKPEPAKPADPQGAITYRQGIQDYKMRAEKKSVADKKELDMVIDACLRDDIGKDLQDCSEPDCEKIIKAIQSHYTAKKAQGANGK